MCLVGADHVRLPRTFPTPFALQRTEILEWCRLSGDCVFQLLPQHVMLHDRRDFYLRSSKESIQGEWSPTVPAILYWGTNEEVARQDCPVVGLKRVKA